MLFSLDKIRYNGRWDSEWELQTTPPYEFCWTKIYGENVYGDSSVDRLTVIQDIYTNPAPISLYRRGADIIWYSYGILHHSLYKEQSADAVRGFGSWNHGTASYSEGEYSFSNINKYNPILGHNDHIQFASASEFENLTLNAGDVFQPMPFNAYNDAIGGIFVIRVTDTLTFNGGHIDLTGAGISTSEASYRPLAAQESNAALDSGTQTGDENKQCVDYFPLNVGDGACFIFAKNIRVTNSASRIGNPNSKGVALCRGAADDSNTPSGTTNIGGSNIFIACETFQGFTPDLISKYRTGSASDGLGKGLCRAFIHVEDNTQCDVPQDGRLYYLDTQATAPKLHLRKNNAVEDIQLSETKSGNAVGIKTADGIFYANLVATNAANASSLRIRLNNTTYALANS